MPPCHCLAIRQAARQVTQLYDHHLASSGLRSTQYAILRVLARTQPVRMQDFAAAIVMDRTTLTRSLRPLERDGLVAVGRGHDGRTRILSLTEAGRRRLQEAQAQWDEAQAEFETRYGHAGMGDLRTMLARVVAQLGQQETHVPVPGSRAGHAA